LSVTLRCDACGSSDLRVLYTDCPDRRHWLGTFDVLQCLRCGTGRTAPRPSEGEIARFYPPEYGSFGGDAPVRGPLFRTLKTIAQGPALLRYGRPSSPKPPREGARALEIGAGTGERLAALAASGWEVTGVEPNEAAAARAVARFPVLRDRLRSDRAERVDFPSASFDLIVMEHVLEHLHEPLAVLERARRWLRDGGALQLWAPNFSSLERRVFRSYWDGLDLPRHLNHFTERALRAALTERGFTVTRAVPEIQASTLAGSVRHVLDALRGRRGAPPAPSHLAYYLLMPLAAALQAAGHRPNVVVTAVAS
jgi:SAM-dependent methyltransferase